MTAHNQLHLDFCLEMGYVSVTAHTVFANKYNKSNNQANEQQCNLYFIKLVIHLQDVLY